MADIRLTCAETPLAWPSTVAISDLKTCASCGIHVFSPQPGSLQILTRRPVGDGVNIEENIGIGADYRGQRYSLEEAVFHTPGLHVFPGQSEVYPAEYHVHMRTFSAPQRSLTLVIPVSHLLTAATGTQDYFAAMAAKPDPSVTRPTLSTLLTAGTQILQYQGSDIRGRTADNPTPDDTCSSTAERQFLLVLQPVAIRAADLERIPREGSMSTDPRNLPAPGVAPTKTVSRDRLLRVSVLATPGILGATVSDAPLSVSAPATKEVECRPLKVVDGRDVVDISGEAVDIWTLLGLRKGGFGLGATKTAAATESSAVFIGSMLLMFIGTILGLVIASWIFGYVWGFFFESSGGRLEQWEPLKLVFFLIIATIATIISVEKSDDTIAESQ